MAAARGRPNLPGGGLTLSEGPERCALCGRLIPAHARASRHHLVPKSEGGARFGTVRLHQICHSAIHARFKENEIGRKLSRIEDLRADPELAGFLRWIRDKPDDFHAPTYPMRKLR
ncbi:hypothetical protein SAMN05519103_08069 [Rhizobiales bacterium GAS113]|nr:hypothetical protein SAMN05519103_08069 [Rhizobiales bacterium GAS113]